MADTVPCLDYHIGQWTFRVSEHCLCDLDHQVQLTQAQSEILLLLVKHFPEPVSSEQLREQAGAELNLSRNNLYQGIAKLRRIFNDSVHKANYIETVPKLGYRLTVSPQVIPQETRGEQESVTTIDLAVGTIDTTVTGSIEQNIFEDLSFINNNGSESSVSAEAMPTHASPPTVSDTASEQQAPDNNDVIAHEIDSESQLPVETKLAAWSRIGEFIKKRRWLLAVCCMLLAFFMMTYRGTPNEQTTVNNGYPEKLYFSDITFEFEEQVTTELLAITSINVVNANIQWWLEQKLQHLPLIKVIEAPEPQDFPLLTTHLTYGSDKLTIQQAYFAGPKSSGELLKPHQLAYDGSISSQQISPELIERFVGDVSFKLTTDSCSFKQFNSDDNSLDLSQPSDCLLENNIAIMKLISALNLTKDQLTNKSDSDKLLQLNTLIRDIKQKFPKNSLGYQASAQLAVLNNDDELAIEQYLNVVELNGSDVDNFIQLAKLYREQKLYKFSRQLLERAIALTPKQESLYYWLARDLLQLGYYYRVKAITEQHQGLMTNLFDRLRFSHINYNTLLEIVQKKMTIGTADQELSSLIATAYGIQAMPVNDIKQAIKLINFEQPDTITAEWRYVSLLIADNQHAQALSYIKQHGMAQITIDDMMLMADQVFYLNNYARLLIANQQGKEAKVLLNALVTFFTSQSKETQLFSTQLAESYALLGNTEQALDELSRVIASGWMPDLRYDIADLRSNHNLTSLANQWQFRALVQLVENRQLLLRKSMTAKVQD